MKKLILLLLIGFGFIGLKAQCDYTINMADSWGDGWNGGSIDVVINCETTNITLPSGFAGTATIPSLTGDVVTFLWNTGSFGNEVSFDILDPSGTTILSQSPAPAAGLFLTNTSNSTCAPTACEIPSCVEASALTISSADMSWVEVGTASSWDIEYGVSPHTFTGTPTTSGVTNSYIVTGLSPAVTYDFRVTGNTCSTWSATETFTTLPNCLPPTLPVTTGITSTGATLDWTGGGTINLWTVEWGPAGYTPGMGTNIFPINPTATASLTGLTPGTGYDWYVSAICGADSSVYVGPNTFFTTPTNDECIDAIGLTVNPDELCGTVTSGSILGATASAQTNGCGGTADDDVWYSFVATTAQHTIDLQNLAGSTTDLYHSVFDAAPGCASLGTQLYCSDPESSVATGLTIGNTYLVRVYTWTGTPAQTSTFDICIGTPPTPPVNDLCAGAIPISPSAEGTGCASATFNLPFTTDGTTDSGVPTVCSTPGLDQWFTWTATTAGLTFSSQNPGSPGIAVYATCADVATGTDLACLGTFSTGALTGWNVGDNLLIHIYDFNGSTSDVAFCLEEFTPPMPPANDTCTNAITLTVNPDQLCGTVTAGTIDGGTTSAQTNGCGGTANDDVWYEFVATGTDHTIDLQNLAGSTTDMYHSVFDATPGCAALGAELYCSDPESSLASGLTIGNTYLVRVYTWTGVAGQTTTFDICIGTPPTPPVNDSCINAITLTVNPDNLCGTVTSGTIQSATASAQANGCGGTADDDVWFEFVATDTAHTVDLQNFTGSTTDMYHSVFDATPGCAALGAELYCSDPNNSFATGLTIGNTYLVRVYTWTATAGQTTTFDICIGTPPPPPVNDDCDDAITLTVNPDQLCGTVTSGTVQSATASAQANGCGGTADDDVWFEFVATNTIHNIDLQNLAGSTTDMYHSVFDATPGCASLGTQLYCSDPESSVATGLTIGNTYLVRVYTWTGVAGQTTTFDICIGTPPPPPVNDECADAITVYGGYSITGFSTVSATGTDITSCTFNDIASVWFVYTPTCTTSITVNTFGSNYDTNLSVWDDCAGTTELACNDDAGGTLQSSVTFSAIEDTTYYFRIAGYNGSTGDINFTVIENTACPCANNIWTGAVDTDWATAGNWSCGTAPTSGCNGTTDNVIIPAGASVTPVVTGSLGVGNLNIDAGSSITIDGTLQICGDATHLGDLVGGVGDLEFVGAAAQTVTGTGDFTNVTVNNGGLGLTADAASDIGITGGLNLEDGDFTNSGSVTLRSSATGTGYLNDFDATYSGTYNGDITVENYITTAAVGLGQRYFGTAVANGVINGLDATYAGYPLGQVQVDVCNVSLSPGSPYSNMFEWHEDASFSGCEQDGWYAIAASTMMENGRGYSGWVNDGSIISVTGAPNTGNILYATSHITASGVPNAEGWHLLSNPYPSPIDISAVFASDFVSPQFYDGSYAYYGSYSPAVLAGNIGSMQGFTAHSDGTGATAGEYSLTNSDRVASNSVSFVSSSTIFDQMLTINVFGNGFGDRTYVYYSDDNSVTDGFDNYGDCTKRNSTFGQPTIYTKLGAENMSLNGFPETSMGESIPMGISHGTDGSFELTFEGMTNFPVNTTIYLEDIQEGVYHNIANGNYAYSALASDDSDRFMIHFVLPIELATVNVNCAGELGAIELVSTSGLLNRDYIISDASTTVASGSLSTLNASVDAGTYNVTINDAFGGNQVYTVTVEEDEAIEALYTVSAIDVQVGEVVAFNNTTLNATNVEWNIANITTITGVNNATYSFDEVGTYEVQLLVSNGDCSDVKTFEVNVSNKTTSVTTLSKDNLVKVYSNEDIVTIEFDNDFNTNAKVEIQNIIGKKVFAGSVSAKGIQTLRIADVTSGYYFVSVEVEGERLSSKVFITKK